MKCRNCGHINPTAAYTTQCEKCSSFIPGVFSCIMDEVPEEAGEFIWKTCDKCHGHGRVLKEKE